MFQIVTQLQLLAVLHGPILLVLSHPGWLSPVGGAAILLRPPEGLKGGTGGCNELSSCDKEVTP